MQDKEVTVNTQITKYEVYSREQLVQRITVMDQELQRLVKENYLLRDQEPSATQLSFVIEDQIASLQEQLYGSKSEKYKNPNKIKDTDKEKAPPKPKVQKPSERYPNLPVRPNIITMDPAPDCDLCGKVMFNSGMTEDSQQITVIPKKYEIVETKRVIFKCNCQGCLITTPQQPKIKKGSVYSDEMIIDVVLSKYCDLIPINRYAAMASREGVANLPPHSLIEISHYFAEYVKPAYELIKAQALKSRVLQADETPHNMLEGDSKDSWYLWGFSTPTECFFECHNTRSGDVASSILEKSLCEVLLTDVYSGYQKATRIANILRNKEGKTAIKNAFCNAHARRYFFQYWKLHQASEDAQFFLDQYQEVYKLNDESKGKGPPEIKALREKMQPYFESMKGRALQDINKYPSTNKLSKAMWYFVNNFSGLTLFLGDHEVLIDNNSQESLLRNPVVGRKTWYGTHSKLGAKTGAVIFTLVETCRLNKVNPRLYFPALIKALHEGRPAFTPYEYSQKI